MAWTFQLTPWALPALLALLVVAREWIFLWPRRREPGSAALMALAAISGLWAALQLLGAALPELEAKLTLFQGQLVLAALAPVAWLVFCLLVPGHKRRLRATPALLLYALTAVTVVLALQGPDQTFLVQRPRLTTDVAGYQGLLVEPGPWYRVHLLVRALAVLGGGAIAVRHLLGLPATRTQVALPGIATVVVLVTAAVQGAGGAMAPWRDLSAPVFALAVALLGCGVLRHRLLNLGPVARTLIMVELRDPLVVLDRRGRIVDLNRAAERILGLEVYGDVPLALETLWASAREREDSYAQVTLPVRVGRGSAGGDAEGPEHRTFEVTFTPLGAKSHSGGQTALLLRDVTKRDQMEQELRKANRELRSTKQELERLANTDSLTSLANRRHFLEALENELDRSQRYDRPLSLILLDLDHFKQINDTYGHAAGDTVLEATADLMRSVCRDVDLPARLGGEELAILLPETRAEGAQVLAERLREGMASREHEADGSRFTVTASLGVATLEGHERISADRLLQCADTALYKAKAAGRNQVAVSRSRYDAGEG